MTRERPSSSLIAPLPPRRRPLPGLGARHRLLAGIVVLAAALAACVPGLGPQLRIIDGQTWASRFEVEANVAGLATVRLPVDLALTFKQRLSDVTATATLQYDTGIFRLQTGGLVELSGHLGLDGRLDLRSSSNVLAFEGDFVGDRLIGTVSIAGVVPVTDVTFRRSR